MYVMFKNKTPKFSQHFAAFRTGSWKKDVKSNNFLKLNGPEFEESETVQ